VQDVLVHRELCRCVSDLLSTPAVRLFCLPNRLRRGKGRTVDGVRAVVCVPSSRVQCPVVYTQHRSSCKLFSAEQFSETVTNVVSVFRKYVGVSFESVLLV